MKAYLGVAGNEYADGMAKLGCECGSVSVVTEGGIRALWKGVVPRSARWLGVAWGGLLDGAGAQ